MADLASDPGHGPKASHALTFTPDHPVGACHRLRRPIPRLAAGAVRPSDPRLASWGGFGRVSGSVSSIPSPASRPFSEESAPACEDESAPWFGWQKRAGIP